MWIRGRIVFLPEPLSLIWEQPIFGSWAGGRCELPLTCVLRASGFRGFLPRYVAQHAPASPWRRTRSRRALSAPCAHRHATHQGPKRQGWQSLLRDKGLPSAYTHAARTQGRNCGTCADVVSLRFQKKRHDSPRVSTMEAISLRGSTCCKNIKFIENRLCAKVDVAQLSDWQHATELNARWQ